MSGVFTAVGGNPHIPDGLMAASVLAANVHPANGKSQNWYTAIGQFETSLMNGEVTLSWFDDLADKIAAVKKGVADALPLPRSASEMAEVSSYLSSLGDGVILAALRANGGRIDAAVSQLVPAADRVVHEADERKDRFIEAAAKDSSSKSKKKVSYKIENDDDLTAEDRRLVEERIRRLQELKEYEGKTRDELMALLKKEGIFIKDGDVRIRLGGDAERYAIIPGTSIRFSDVKEVVVGGIKLYEVSIKTLPILGAAGISLDKSLTDKFTVSADWLKEHGYASAQELAKKLTEMKHEEMLELMRKIAEETRNKLLETAKAVAAPILGTAKPDADPDKTADAGDLGTLAPASVGLDKVATNARERKDSTVLAA